MRKVSLVWIVILVMVLFNNEVSANSFEEDKEVLSFIQEGFEAQILISEKPRNLEEIKYLLQPYFTIAIKRVN